VFIKHHTQDQGYQITLIFLKGDNPQIPILHETKESGSVLHMTNAFGGTKSPTYLGYS
jgi:hypothetical protein